MSIQRKSTERIELVETHNLALSIRRLRDITPYDSSAWKRALLHAVGMAQLGNDTVRRMREAMDLP